MNSLTINNIDSWLYEALRVEADLQGRSIVEQACVILKGALEHTQNIDGLGTRIHERFKDVSGIELDLPVR
ncbi:plasmid stabilization protein [Pseudomonas sp. R4-83]|uniref:FitA-like ribbon-helix-helix domain-containing protein n=1 Tax=unclassified Pseudomonas TaxID=196821 RepID=UPI003DA9FE8D